MQPKSGIVSASLSQMADIRVGRGRAMSGNTRRHIRRTYRKPRTYHIHPGDNGTECGVTMVEDT